MVSLQVVSQVVALYCRCRVGLQVYMVTAGVTMQVVALQVYMVTLQV